MTSSTRASLYGWRQYDRSFNKLLIDSKIVACHTCGAEAFLEELSAAPPTECRNALCGPHGILQVLHDEAGDPFFDDLRYRATPIGDHRRAARHGLDHDQPEGLRPVDGEEQGISVAQKRILFAIADLPPIFDMRIFEQRCDHVLEVATVYGVALGGNFDLH